MQVVICCPTRSNIMTGRLLIMNAWYLHRLVSNLVQQLKLTHIFCLHFATYCTCCFLSVYWQLTCMPQFLFLLTISVRNFCLYPVPRYCSIISLSHQSKKSSLHSVDIFHNKSTYILCHVFIVAVSHGRTHIYDTLPLENRLSEPKKME